MLEEGLEVVLLLPIQVLLEPLVGQQEEQLLD